MPDQITDRPSVIFIQKMIDDIHGDLVMLTNKMNRALDHGILTEFAVPMQNGRFDLQVRFVQEIRPSNGDAP